MFVRQIATSLLAVAAIAGCAAPEPHRHAAPNEFQPIGKACGDRDGWSDVAPPAPIFANVYMVGTCGIVSLLITTSQGHFLIDGATAEAASSIAENIRSLGFDPRDVRYLLASHEHTDHVGGLAELKRITGAKFVTRAEALTAMESGGTHDTDPQLGLLPPFEGLKAEIVIGDGDTLKIGNQVLTMMATPGHTPGGTSWTWKSCDGTICREIVYADSLSAVSADNYRFTDHPGYVATLRATIARITALKNCDILITPHPAASELFERLADKTKLARPNGCKDYAARANDRLDARLAKEALN